jgi:adenosine kinase
MNLSGWFYQTFVLNLSAPFIAQFFNVQLQKILPYIDFLIGNEAEAETWASANGLADPKDLVAVAKSLAEQPKSDPSRDRVVIFTHGAQETIAVSSSRLDKHNTYPVNVLKDEEIVDTNGAGDAFAGGFIGALAAGKKWEEAIEVGHTLGTMCVTQVGPQYKWPKVNVL